MSDRWAVALALCAAAGAGLARGPAPVIGVTLALVALFVRWPWLLCVASALLTGGLAARALDGLRLPADRTFDATVTLLTDPEPTPFGDLQVDVRLPSGEHVEATARSPDTIAALRPRQGGQSIALSGKLSDAPAGSDWLTTRHIAGRLSIASVGRWTSGNAVVRLANALRSTLQRGAQALPERQRSLFLGFVLGDTRGQAPDVTDDFRGSGLSHLLAVSGENVAFVLVLASPLLRRLGMRTRTVATIAVVAFFALVTRFEPSVLRASAMAALAAVAVGMGRTASTIRLLAFAVTGLLVVDPLLVRSVGFQLSVCASAAIVVLAPAVARTLPLPDWLSRPLAITIAAQVGVAPLLLTTFGGVPVASVPANLLAVPAAGPVMVWGLTAGLAAGAAGGGVAALLHLPTRVLIGWLAFVAHAASAAPLGELGGLELLIVAAALAIGTAGAARSDRLLRWASAVLLVVGLTVPAIALRAPPPFRTEIAPGATLWQARSGAVLELSGRPDPASLLEGLRRAGVGSLTAIVVTQWSTVAPSAVDAVGRRAPAHAVFVPPGARLDDAIVVGEPYAFAVGGLDVSIEPDDHDLHLIVRARAPPE